MYCRKCGKELNESAMYCNSCGTSIDRSGNDASSGSAAPQMPYAQKNVGISLVLGFFIPGLGHIYIGKLARGLSIMAGYILIEVLIILIWFSNFNIDYLDYDDVVRLVILILSLSIPAYALSIWNLFDVNSLGKEYNDRIRKTGTPPW